MDHAVVAAESSLLLQSFELVERGGAVRRWSWRTLTHHIKLHQEAL